MGIAIAAVIGGLLWLGRPTSTDKELGNAGAGAGNSGSLAAEESTFDFGAVSMASGNVSHLFRIKNSGSSAIAVTKLYTSCMCTTATLINGNERNGPFGMPGHGFIPLIQESIGPGQEADIEVVFDPTAHGPAGIGRIERIVYVEQKYGETLELQIGATVTP